MGQALTLIQMQTTLTFGNLNHCLKIKVSELTRESLPDKKRIPDYLLERN